jgi:orotate phosphoribosyltransferase-like protein
MTCDQMEKKMGRPKRVSDEKFLELYNKGLNDYDIARKLGVSRTVIWYARKRAGLKPLRRKKKL